MEVIVLAFTIVFIFILLMYCIQRGNEKRIGLIGVILIMHLCTPFFGYFVVEALANKKRPCKWCGNNDNESDYCGICKLNEAGYRKA